MSRKSHKARAARSATPSKRRVRDDVDEVRVHADTDMLDTIAIVVTVAAIVAVAMLAQRYCDLEIRVCYDSMCATCGSHLAHVVRKLLTAMIS